LGEKFVGEWVGGLLNRRFGMKKGPIVVDDLDRPYWFGIHAMR
jgi:hypothetical protein